MYRISLNLTSCPACSPNNPTVVNYELQFDYNITKNINNKNDKRYIVVEGIAAHSDCNLRDTIVPTGLASPRY